MSVIFCHRAAETVLIQIETNDPKKPLPPGFYISELKGILQKKIIV